MPEPVRFVELRVSTTFSHQLVPSRTDGLSFPVGAEYLTYLASILVGRISQCGMHFFLFGRPPPGQEEPIWLAPLA